MSTLHSHAGSVRAEKTMPAMGLRHPAFWVRTTGWYWGAVSLSWGTGGKSQREVAMAAGWPRQEQNAENAGSLPQHVPQRKQMPRAWVWRGGREQEQAGCPGPPPHTCCPLTEGQALTWKGKRGQACDPFKPQDTVSPT